MEYNAQSVEQLTFREGVRKRIGIYLGSADHTGVIAGLLELVNNATDEALVCKTANRIELVIGKDFASCRDYGRGMPHGPNDFTNEVMINLLTENHSGAKFDDNAYGGKSRGLNGTGSAATCCSSDWFKISSYRDNAEWYMEFEKGIPKWDTCQKKPLNGLAQGTYIIYKPSQEVFSAEPIHFDFEEVCSIIEEYSYFNKGVEFIVTSAETKEIKRYLSQNGLMDFADKKVAKRIHKHPIHIQTTEDDIDIEIILNWTTGRERFYLFSNGGENENGGTPKTGLTMNDEEFEALRKRSNELSAKYYNGEMSKEDFITEWDKLYKEMNKHPIYKQRNNVRILSTKEILAANKELELKDKFGEDTKSKTFKEGKKAVDYFNDKLKLFDYFKNAEEPNFIDAKAATKNKDYKMKEYQEALKQYEILKKADATNLVGKY